MVVADGWCGCRAVKISTEAMPARRRTTAHGFLIENRPAHKSRQPPPRLTRTPRTLMRLKPFIRCGTRWMRKTPAKKQAM